MRLVLVGLAGSLLVLSLLSCSSYTRQQKFFQNSKNFPVVQVDKEVKPEKFKILLQDLSGGFKSISEKKIAMILFQDLPDSYLLRAKDKLAPPDSANGQLRNLESDRLDILNQAFVTFCETCKNFDSKSVHDEFSEEIILSWLHKISLGLEVSASELRDLASKVEGYDFLWVFLAADDFEFERKWSTEKTSPPSVVTKTINEMKIRSYLYDIKSGKIRLSIESLLEDMDIYTYAPAQPDYYTKNKEDISHPSLDGDYPYPPESDSLSLLKTNLYGLVEKVSSL